VSLESFDIMPLNSPIALTIDIYKSRFRETHSNIRSVSSAIYFPVCPFTLKLTKKQFPVRMRNCLDLY